MIINMNKKTIFVAIAGKPNVGKSTILNFFLGEKLSIVSSKPQTTRNAIRGILTKDDTQVVFIDTPGILKNPKGNLQSVITKNAWNALDDVDIICVVVDASKGFSAEIERITRYINAKNQNMICILNKTDAVVNQGKNYEIAQKIWDLGLFKEIFPVCAIKKKGLDSVLNYLIKNAKPVNEWFYNEDDLTDKPNNFIVSEFTREAIFNKLNQELPYNITVETDSFEMQDDCINIEQSIIISRESHKKIVLGEHGSMIKSIRLITQEKLTKFYQKPVILELMVKVRENWIASIDVE